jgi:hypothetical protein
LVSGGKIGVKKLDWFNILDELGIVLHVKMMKMKL